MTTPVSVRSCCDAAAIPKSASFAAPVDRDQDVSGLDVAMQDLLVVRGREAGEHVVEQRGDTRDLERSGSDLVGHGAAGQALHDDEEDVAVTTEVVHRDDVRMLDRRCGLRFAFEAGRARRRCRNGRGSSSFTATSRPKRSSIARYTTAMPPPPSRDPSR